MERIYNSLKLSVYRPLFRSKRVLVIGGGAVGSFLLEMVTRMGSSADVIDPDRFTLENAAKHSRIVRTPEDVGRNKAECVSNRAKPFLEEGCETNGIDADLCMLGPEAIAAYDVVVLAVDNYAAKVLFNELFMRIPIERRPVVIMDGTYDETAQSVALDGRDFCLRCLFDESWLKNSAVRTSCSGPQLRQIDGVQETVRTSGLASSIAANMSAEQFRAIVIGAEGVVNHRLTYTAYPNIELSATQPIRKNNCPGCSIHPPKTLWSLDGCVLTTTLGKALEMIAHKSETNDFEVSTHRLNYKGLIHSEFIVSDVCHSCGRPISVMRHDGRTYLTDLICDECRQAGKTPRYDPSFREGLRLHAFTLACEDAIKDKTLFELGYPLGAHIEVIMRNGALNCMDKGKIKKMMFTMKDDPKQMHLVHKL